MSLLDNDGGGKQNNMNLFDSNNFQFVHDDPDVLCRVKNPRYDSEITFLTTDGTTMKDDELFKIDKMDKQWFVILNNPLLQEKIQRSIENNADEYGMGLARFLPLSFVIQSALEEIMERQQIQQEEQQQ